MWLILKNWVDLKVMNHEELRQPRRFVLARLASSFLQGKVTSRKAVEKAETKSGKNIKEIN